MNFDDILGLLPFYVQNPFSEKSNFRKNFTQSSLLIP